MYLIYFVLKGIFSGISHCWVQSDLKFLSQPQFVSLTHSVVSFLLSALINCLMGLVVAFWGPCCQPSRAGFWWLVLISPSQACVVETWVNHWDSKGAARINTLLYKLSLSPAGTHLNTHRQPVSDRLSRLVMPCSVFKEFLSRTPIT